jgi:starch phosphorylase
MSSFFLGRSNTADSAEAFNMAYLAMRGSGAVNGVSRLHGEVSRHIFQPLFPLWPYQKLEQEVIPCFYGRDEDGLPKAWVARVRESMARLTTRYSSNRMMREYAETYYLPLAEAFRNRNSDVAVELQDWHRQLAQHWPRIHFGRVSLTTTEQGYRFEVQVYLDDMPAEDVLVGLYAEPVAGGEVFSLPLVRGAKLSGTSNAYVYQGIVPADRPDSDYTPRIVPAHAAAKVPLEANFILWYR